MGDPGVGCATSACMPPACAGMRADKVKSEKAALAIKKGTKKNLNLGTRGGGAAGLDDYQFESAAQDDGDDFM